MTTFDADKPHDDSNDVGNNQRHINDDDFFPILSVKL